MCIEDLAMGRHKWGRQTQVNSGTSLTLPADPNRCAIAVTSFQVSAFISIFRNALDQANGFPIITTWSRVTDGTSSHTPPNNLFMKLEDWGTVVQEALIVVPSGANIKVLEIMMTNDLAQAVDNYARENFGF